MLHASHSLLNCTPKQGGFMPSYWLANTQTSDRVVEIRFRVREGVDLG